MRFIRACILLSAFSCLNFSSVEAQSLPLSAFARSPKHTKRNYYAPLTDKEKEKIIYILSTLAHKPTATLLFYKSSLKKAGDAINHVHPLKFLGFVFGDQKLSSYMGTIRYKGWVWGDFIDSLKDVLDKEAEKHNLKTEFIRDFSSQLSLNFDTILPLVKNHKWNEFIDLLISEFS